MTGGRVLAMSVAVADDRVYRIPFSMLIKYMSVPQMMKWSTTSKAFRKAVFVRVPRFTIHLHGPEQLVRALSMKNTFREVRFTVDMKNALDRWNQIGIHRREVETQKMKRRGPGPSFGRPWLMEKKEWEVLDQKDDEECGVTTSRLESEALSASWMDEDLKLLGDRVTSLDLNTGGRDPLVTGDGVRALSGLTSLSLRGVKTIGDGVVSALPGLTSLDLRQNEMISDHGIRPLRHLTTLYLDSESPVTDDELQRHTGLTDLDIARHPTITDAGICALVHLRRLVLHIAPRITGTGFVGMTQLTSLDLGGGRSPVTDEILRGVPSLTQLNLWANETVTDEGVRCLKQLRSLCLRANRTITDRGIEDLTSLTVLDLSMSSGVTDAGLVRLTNLVSLDISNTSRIKGTSFSGLVNLTELSLAKTSVVDRELLLLAPHGRLRLLNLRAHRGGITDKGIERFHGLSTLDLSHMNEITADGLLPLVALRTLNLLSNDKIGDSEIATITSVNGARITRVDKFWNHFCGCSPFD